jgi:sugar phosphate isomerase/epimerase
MRLSISSWTLHGLIGSGVPLLDIPAQIAQRGIHTLEVCHFHLPTTEASYLAEFRGALRAANVELYSVLIDRGDITSPDPQQRAADLHFIRQWIEVAAALGAVGVRIDAGLESPSPEVVRLSATHLAELAHFAAGLNVAAITENWHATSRYPRPLLDILDRCEGKVRLCADLGNAEGHDKYETLELLLPRATSIHFKARYDAQGRIDATDHERCCALIRNAGFSGPISLIYSETANEWEAVEQLKEAVSGLLS